MAGDLPKIYWDACVCLSYVNKLEDRLPHIDWYLERSGKEFQIVTSVLSVAEVSFAEIEKNSGILSDDVMRRIQSLWMAADSPIRLAEVHLQLATKARDLARAALARGHTMKGGDALHMATAQSLGVSEIHTYSRDWPRHADLLGMRVGLPIAVTPNLPGTER